MEFETEINFQPATVVITDYEPARTLNYGHPDDREPDEPARAEWNVVGEHDISKADERRIDDEAITIMESMT